MTIREMEEEISKLTGPEKMELLRRLIADLDDTRDEAVERAWLMEAQRRYKELKDGVVQAVPARDAIAKARERLLDVRGTSS